MVDFIALKRPFPPEAISWRLGVVSGNKGLPLAYLNARDVMDRLDEVCSPEGWQCRYSHADATKTVCEIGIRVERPLNLAEWLWKADGAGETNIEAEKGSLSDAYKRAAVRWGIGRYLYDVKAPWISLDVTDSKRPQIPGHELERLMALLPGYTGGVTVSPLSGQAKTPGKFWENKSYNIMVKLPKALQTAHGDADWDNPDTIVWMCESMPNIIDKAPNRLALTKLQADNLFWINSNLPEPDRNGLMESFAIRASQFDGVKK